VDLQGKDLEGNFFSLFYFNKDKTLETIIAPTKDKFKNFPSIL